MRTDRRTTTNGALGRVGSRRETEARRGERRRRRTTPCRFGGLSPAAAETGGGSPTDQHNAAGRQPDAVDLILSATRECEYAGRPLGSPTLSCRGAARRGAASTTARGALYYRRLACASCARGSERSAACLLTYALFRCEETPRSVPTMTRRRRRRSRLARYGNPGPSLVGWPAAEETASYCGRQVKLHRRRQSLAGRRAASHTTADDNYPARRLRSGPAAAVTTTGRLDARSVASLGDDGDNHALHSGCRLSPLQSSPAASTLTARLRVSATIVTQLISRDKRLAACPRVL